MIALKNFIISTFVYIDLNLWQFATFCMTLLPTKNVRIW